MNLRRILFIIIILCVHNRHRAAMQKVEKDSEGLLPKALFPEVYTLHIVPDMDKSVFSGTVSVLLNARESTSRIVFNARDLDISEVSVKIGGELATVGEQEYDKKLQQMTLAVDKIEAGSTVTLSMAFSGEIKENMVGFYKSSYLSKDSETQYLYSTQFESTDARRAFPCWDEPLFKARFNISITAPKDLTVLSNMDVVEKASSDEDSVTFVFRETPRMSTYLVAYVIGDLGYLETTSKGRPLRVFTIRGSEAHGEYALKVGAYCLEFFEEYFDYEYPLPKMDMVAIPEFSAGAMENWGLVTYRSIALLYDDANSSIRIKANIAATICHELAHQWFGNLVTMKWWNDLWLNEGFATWAGTLAVDSIKDKIGLVYDVWGDFVTHDIEHGRGMDGKAATHPIDVKVRDGGEISSIFGAIVYSKGASLIHMLANYLGVDNFRNGLRRYIKENAYKNTTTNDLWAAIEEETGNGEVHSMMDNWTKHPGFPVVFVSEGEAEVAPVEDYDGRAPKKGKISGTSVWVRQERYLPKDQEAEARQDVLWNIPLSVKVYEKGKLFTESTRIFNWKEAATTVEPKMMYVFNSNGAGFYRVRYSDAIYSSKILSLLEGGQLSSLDRLSLVMDLVKFAEDGHVDVDFLLTTLRAFKEEENYRVLSALTGWLHGLQLVFSKEQGIQEKVSGEIEFLLEGREDISLERAEDDIEKRQMNILVVCGMADIEGTKLQQSISEAFKKSPGSVLKFHPDFKGSVFQSIAKFHGRDGFDFLMQIIKENKSEDETLRAILALGYVRDKDLFDEVFEIFAGDTSLIRKQDKMRLIYGMANNAAFKEETYFEFKRQFKRILKKFKDNENHVSTFIERAGSVQSSKAVLQDMEDFFGEYKHISAIARGIDKTITNARNNVSFYERNIRALSKWANE